MSTCTVPANQPIYQALLDKAASYPADKPYQAKAYKKAAESVLAHTWNIADIAKKGTWWQGQGQYVPGVSTGIRTFITDFVKTNPEPKAEPPKSVEPTITFPTVTGAAKAMDDASKAAAAAAPKDVTTWPNDDAARAAFQAKVTASNTNEPSKTVEPVAPVKPAWSQYFENLYRPVAYTAENPRRSKRNANKPKVQYFAEDDDVVEAIEAVCDKKGWVYSDDLLTEFNTWLPTADKYALKKYDVLSGKDIPRSKPEVAKQWAMYYSASLLKQQKDKKANKALVKYCEKNNIEYQAAMIDKFNAWMADPANKPLITYTYSSYGGCNCANCNPTGTPRDVKEYSYDRSTAYCINKWFSTLKKQIVW